MAVTHDLLSGMPLVLLRKELICLWNSILPEPGQPSAQLSKLIHLTACKKTKHTVSQWYRTVYIPWSHLLWHAKGQTFAEFWSPPKPQELKWIILAWLLVSAWIFFFLPPCKYLMRPTNLLFHHSWMCRSKDSLSNLANSVFCAASSPRMPDSDSKNQFFLLMQINYHYIVRKCLKVSRKWCQ